MNCERTLENIDLLGDLDPEDRLSVAKLCHWREVRKNQVVIDRDDDSRDVYLVVEGQVRVVNNSVTGKEVSFHDMGPGQHFGEMAAIDRGPRSARVVALADTRLAVLIADDFLRLLRRHPEISIRLLRDMSEMVRRANDRIMYLSTASVQARVIAEILRLGLAHAGDDNTAILDPPPAHGDIASRVSATRETVARIIGDLMKAGLIRKTHHMLVIDDLAALSDRARREL